MEDDALQQAAERFGEFVQMPVTMRVTTLEK